MADTIQHAIETEAKDAILSMVADGHRVEGRSIGELIEADRYLKAQAAAANGIGLRFHRTIPPGSV